MSSYTSFIKNEKSLKKSYLSLHYAFLIFFNPERELDKSYMINHVVYCGLKTVIICTESSCENTERLKAFTLCNFAYTAP